MLSYKLHGVSLDQDLSFTTQIDDLCKKLSKRIGLLRHISPYLKQNQREIYYSAIIKPVLLYGSTIWCSCEQDDLQRVLKLQKRAARVILDAERTACSVGLALVSICEIDVTSFSEDGRGVKWLCN